MTTVDSQGRSIQVPIPTCNYDNKQASWFTTDLLYVCEDHSEGKEVFPLAQAPVAIKFPDQGIQILRRARKIDQVCELLRNIPSELEQVLIASIEKDFQSAMDALSESKEKITIELQKELAKLRSELDSIIDTFEKEKLEETIQTSGTRLEESVLTLPLSEVQEKLQSEQWLRFSCNRETLESLKNNFCCVRRSGTLLDLPPAACEWKDNYYCLPGSKFKIFEISSGEIYDCGVDLQYEEGMVWTGLPDGSFFFCGNELTTDCKQLNSEFTNIATIGSLQAPRSFAGIIYFEGSVYVFGGMEGRSSLKSIEEFNMRTCSSVTLSVQMHSSRSSFSPCVWKRQIFLGPGIEGSSIEVFDPEEAVCSVGIEGFGSCYTMLVPVSEEEIVVLAGNVIRYFPYEGLTECLTNENKAYDSPGGVVTNSGKSFFAIRKKNSYWSIQYLSEDKAIVKVARISN